MSPRRAARPVRGARPRRGGQARKPRAPLRQRVGRFLPSPGRALAGLLAVGLVAGFIVLLNGPWLRISDVEWHGRQLTAERDLRDEASAVQGQNALLVDSGALQRRIEALPGVSGAEVSVRLPGRVAITLHEEAPAFVWRTSAVQLVGSPSGAIIGQVARDAALPDALATLPFIDDRRRASRDLTVGDSIDPDTLAIALELARVDPAALGSATSGLSVHIDEEFGFVLDSAEPAWSAAFGVYGMDPELTQDPAARIERQVAGVRTLFSEQPEAGIGWLDVRNPGRVYWRPQG
ncbi:MAG TPA: FtsQ-type POTRA domain-containing protein [Candidatus Limnocylindria bacterium]|nr:FtsQ-type POTRA domain-containing protein [Candidatus Limnocylindria bacterium]